MVALIIAFPQLVSVEQKTNMNEQLELKIDAPADYGTPPAGTEAPADDAAADLNFSSDTDKPEPAPPAEKKYMFEPVSTLGSGTNVDTSSAFTSAF
jgi:hypothetical protein